MIPTVNVTEAHEQLQDGTLLIDVREDDEWNAGHIPGAKHTPMSRFMDHVAELPKDASILVHCAVGGRSAQVAHWLNENGYAAFNVAGGIQSWAAHGLPVEA